MVRLFCIILILFLLAGCEGNRGSDSTKKMSDQEINVLHQQAKAIFGPVPDKMPGAEKDSAEMVALGKKLYFDPILSINKTQSCNTCHRLDAKKGGDDNLPTSPGAHGKPGTRNSPTVLNAGFHFVQFWDGRAADLVEQAKGPVLNPAEMAMPDEKTVAQRLSTSKEYTQLFQKAFAKDKNVATYDNMARAIAAFERTLITHDRFDDFVKGQKDALTSEELDGLQLMVSKGCIACHRGHQLGGNIYQKMGLVNAYENSKDLGRYEVTKKAADKYIFKVPGLRNVALTYPYFHDGKVATLSEAIAKIAWLQLGIKLTPKEVRLLEKFFKTLSDKERI